MKFLTHKLANGLDIVAEVNEHAVSTSIGFFVRAGARDETPEIAGVSHFLEHMAFKGTDRRTPDDINRLFDEIGAKYNAYTSEEHTVYHAAILPEYLPLCLDLLGDLIRPTLRREDFELERAVIIEEIGMYADSAMWSAYDHVIRNHFDEHPLGNSILGSKASIEALSLDAMRQYHAERYSPSNIVLAASGRLDFDEFVRMVEKKCGWWEGKSVTRQVDPALHHGSNQILHRPEFQQESLYLVGDAPSATDPLRFAADVLSVVIGDDTGSRFYWAMVDPGKVESIEMSYHEYEGAGAYIIGATCESGQAAENLETIRQIHHEVTQNGITADELAQAKSKIAARLVLSAERPRSRLFPVGYNWMYRQEYRTVEEDLAELDRVTLAGIEDLLRAFPLDDMTTVCLGPLTNLGNLDSLTAASFNSRAARLNRV